MSYLSNPIGGVMVSVLASGAVYRWFEPKTIQLVFVASPISIALRRKSKDGLARNEDNVSEWGDMSTCGLLIP